MVKSHSFPNNKPIAIGGSQFSTPMPSRYSQLNTNNHIHAEKLSTQLLIAYWGLFLSFLGAGFLIPGGRFPLLGIPYRILNFATYGWVGWILFLTFKNWKWLFRECLNRTAAFILFLPLLWLVIFEVPNGFLLSEQPEEFYRNLAWEFLPIFAIISAIAAGGSKGFQARFSNMICIQAFLGGLLALYVIQNYPILDGRGDIASPHYFALGMSNFSILAMANIRLYKLLNKLMAISSYACFTLIMIAYQSRGSSVNALFVFPLAFIITQIRLGIGDIIRIRTLAAILVIVGLLTFGVWESEFVREQVQIGWEGTLTRLYGGSAQANIIQGLKESIGDEIDRSRGAEAEEFLSKATFYTWLIGYGWGGAWHSTVMAGGGLWYMVHTGPLHLILKGGIFFAFLYLALLITALIRSWKAVKYEPLAPACFCYLLYYSLDFMKHGPVGNSYQFYIVWLALGFGLSFHNGAAWLSTQDKLQSLPIGYD